MMVIVDTSGVAFNCNTVSPPKVGSTRCSACGNQIRRNIVKRGIPIAFALAGGYRWGGLTLAQVAALHLETVRACAAD